MFYDLFAELCNSKGVRPSRACIDMGLSRSLAAKWKSTGENPRADVLPKIAEYFNVSVSYLLGEEKEKPTLSGEQISEARKKVIDGLEDMTDEELLLLAARIKAIKDSRI